ncbi:MAG: glycosyltransferase family 4 protein [Sulfolobaceae archaeon]|nr:glycosyltransferase family 4 protein [Sulfolobaceae archaeon]
MYSVAINTQTPPIRFLLNYKEILEKYGFTELPLDISQLTENEDYYITVGGVSRMMISLAKEANFSKVRWVSLGPGYPPSIKMLDFEVHFVDMDPKRLVKYTNFKEGIYNECHRLNKYDIKPEEYAAYAEYNWKSTEKLLEFLSDTDIYFINDFQQLLVGGLIGPSAPAVLWFHIPFVPENLSRKVREFIIRSFEGFDEIIVSTKRDLEGLVRAGVKVKAKQIYPFIDPNSYYRPNKSEVEQVSQKFGIKDDDTVILLVGRMDPIKSQDVAIKAIKNVNAKLVLVGDGSFTSKALGHDKASNWVRRLLSLSDELKVRDKVVITGYVSDKELGSLFSRADVVLLSSNIEGFGLTVCEGWVYNKAVVVSSGAGASELVIDGVNGYVFKSGDHEDLVDKLNKAMKERDKLAEGSQTGLRLCTAQSAWPRVKEAFEDAMKEYK